MNICDVFETIFIKYAMVKNISKSCQEQVRVGCKTTIKEKTWHSARVALIGLLGLVPLLPTCSI
jgi:hypothetical protein